MKMKIYYSGVSGTYVFPEYLIADKKPPVMLSYYDLRDGNATAKRRFKKHRMNLKKIKNKNK